MCIDCWRDNGAPTDWNPEVAKVAALIRHLYDDLGESTGGPLHVVLDDWNVDDWCIKPYWFGDEDAEVVSTVNDLVERLLALSLPERRSALAHHDGLAREGVAVTFVNGQPVVPEMRYVQSAAHPQIWVPEQAMTTEPLQ